MKRTFGELSSNNVDIVAHAKLCLQYFQLVIHTPANNASSSGIKEAVSAVYQDASVMIGTLLQSNSLVACEASSPESSSTSFPATMLIRDLILLTSFVCINSHEFATHQKKSSPTSSGGSVSGNSINSRGDFIRRNTVSPLSALIAIAPFWAVAALISQSKVDPNGSQNVKAALKSLLTSKITSRAHFDISEEILHCTNNISSHSVKSTSAEQVLTRLRRALRTHLKNILLFSVILSVSLHSELSATLHNAALSLPQAAIDHLLSTSDDNSIEIVKIVVNNVPQLAIVTDTGSVGATPLAYAAAYRCNGNSDAPFLEYKLALGLCKVLTDVASSALAISDRLGMLPLHHAARKGHPIVVDYLSEKFDFTVPLRDSSGKTALHHALISWKQLNEYCILGLASMFPRFLKESTPAVAFDPLDYARRNCPESLWHGLAQIYAASLANGSVAEGAFNYQVRSPSGNVSTSTDPEFSESDVSNEDDMHHENESIISCNEQSNMKLINSSSVSKDQDLLQYADTLLLLQSAKATNLEEEKFQRKRQKVN